MRQGKKVFGRSRNVLSSVAIMLIAVVLLCKMFNAKLYGGPTGIIKWDAVSYYAYLPALFAEHDLTLSFVKENQEYYIGGDRYWPEWLPDGGILIKTTMGLSFLYCPFFLVAHALAGPLGYPSDGFGPPYSIAVLLSCIFWVILGCIFLRKVLLAHFSDLSTTIVLVVVVLATNLLYYATYDAAYSHGYLFGLISLFLYQTWRWHTRPTWWMTVAVGLNLGLISLIRATDALVLVYFLLYDIKTWQDFGRKTRLYFAQWPKVLVMVACTVAVWIPQMAYWHYITGQFVFFSYTNNEHFFWTAPKIVEGVFGFRKGWLVYTPVMVFALVGLIPLYRRQQQFFWPTVAFLALDIYVLTSWWCWWYGGCFGQRSMIDCYGLLAVPMAAFLEWVLGRRAVYRCPLLAAFAAVAYLSFFQYKQYEHQAIHFDAMTRAAYFDSFGHKHPSSRFKSLLEHPDYEAAKNGAR